MKLHKLADVYIQGLRDLYDAERRIARDFPRLAEQTADSTIRDRLRVCGSAAEGRLLGLSHLLAAYGAHPGGELCDPVHALLSEAAELVATCAEHAVCDRVLLGRAQRIEQYQSSGFEIAAGHARSLRLTAPARWLDRAADESAAAAGQLSRISAAAPPNAAAA